MAPDIDWIDLKLPETTSDGGVTLHTKTVVDKVCDFNRNMSIISSLIGEAHNIGKDAIQAYYYLRAYDNANSKFRFFFLYCTLIGNQRVAMDLDNYQKLEDRRAEALQRREASEKKKSRRKSAKESARASALKQISKKKPYFWRKKSNS